MRTHLRRGRGDFLFFQVLHGKGVRSVYSAGSGVSAVSLLTAIQCRADLENPVFRSTCAPTAIAF